MAQPIYMPQYDPWAGVREGVMQMAMGYGQNMQRKNQLSQMQNMLGMLQPNEQGMIDTSQLMGGVTDPGMIQGILPHVIENNMGVTKAQRAAQAEAGKPVKMTLWKGSKATEVMVPQDRWNDYAMKAEELGYTVSEKTPQVPMQIGSVQKYTMDVDGKSMEVALTYKGEDENGNPIFEPAMLGGQPIMGEKRNGVTINMPKAAPEGQIKQLSDLMVLSGNIQRIEDLYKPGYVGLISGRAGTLGADYGLPGLVTEKEVEFRQIVDQMKDDLLRAKSGAQINEQEYKRLSKFLPDYNKPEKTFKAQMAAFKKTLSNTIKQKQFNLAESGYIPPTAFGDQIQVQGGVNAPTQVQTPQPRFKIIGVK